MSSLPLPIAAFFAGLISFLSPCVLPLVPGYVSLISGAGLDELKSPQGQLMRRVLVNSVGFILGFSVVFVTLGAISTEIGQLAARYKHTLSIVAGVVIILFGLHLTGIFKIKALYADARLHSVKGSSTPIGALVISGSLQKVIDLSSSGGTCAPSGGSFNCAINVQNLGLTTYSNTACLRAPNPGEIQNWLHRVGIRSSPRQGRDQSVASP